MRVVTLRSKTNSEAHTETACGKLKSRVKPDTSGSRAANTLPRTQREGAGSIQESARRGRSSAAPYESSVGKAIKLAASARWSGAEPVNGDVRPEAPRAVAIGAHDEVAPDLSQYSLDARGGKVRLTDDAVDAKRVAHDEVDDVGSVAGQGRSLAT
jgi:hypothetical protein